MGEKNTTLTFRILKAIVKLVYPKIEIVGLDNLPTEPCMIVANHCQLNGPIVGEVCFPGKRKIWTAWQVMRWKEAPSYAFQDFWSQKPKWTHWYFKAMAYLVTPLLVYVNTHASTIPVYHDMRLMTTFRETIAALQAGENVIIFPEYDQKHNHIVYEFQDKFVDVARMYYKKTGKVLQFVPMYVAPKLKQAVLGEPIPFDVTADHKAERGRIKDALMEAVTGIAISLPRHTVIPYRNIPKRLYPTNIPQEAEHEKTRG